jgi:hypothetical protein
VEINEKVHHADDGKDHPPVRVAVWIGDVVVHSIFQGLMKLAVTICEV